ncbi:MAG: Protein AmpD [candidate division TM6 bacterium GW2011_GWE2_41_16]|nr:MAG: Protein AmpD [candidate division TM6 bacterium GW2011_GWE2_41_16]
MGVKNCFIYSSVWLCFFVHAVEQPQIIECLLPDTEAWPEKRVVDTILLHTSCYMPQLDAAIEQVSDDIFSVEGAFQVWRFYHKGPHYTIDRAGTIYRNAPENDLAHHAQYTTMPQPDGRVNCNLFSIGIELINDECHSITQQQYESLVWLIKDIQTRHDIKHVLGHSMVASRPEDIAFRNELNMLGTIGEFIKTDPWGLDWHYLNLLYHDRKSQYGH